MRLIDADVLKDYIIIRNVGCGCSEDYQKKILESIDDQPTIEPEPCGDADTISRQAAIDAFDKQYWNYLNIPLCKEIRNAAKRTIKDLPSAQPDWNEMLVICDCCGHAIHVKRKEE